MTICFAILYNILAFSINRFGIKNKPEDYDFPRYQDLWIIIAGMVLWLFIFTFVELLGKDHIKNVTEFKGSKAEKKASVKRSVYYIYSYIFYLLAVVWGWFVLKDTTWLPRLLGGGDGAGPVAAMRRYPFIP